MDLLLKESGKKFGEQYLYAFSRQFGKREIEDLLRTWNNSMFIIDFID